MISLSNLARPPTTFSEKRKPNVLLFITRIIVRSRSLSVMIISFKIPSSYDFQITPPDLDGVYPVSQIRHSISRIPSTRVIRYLSRYPVSDIWLSSVSLPSNNSCKGCRRPPYRSTPCRTLRRHAFHFRKSVLLHAILTTSTLIPFTRTEYFLFSGRIIRLRRPAEIRTVSYLSIGHASTSPTHILRIVGTIGFFTSAIPLILSTTQRRLQRYRARPSIRQ